MKNYRSNKSLAWIILKSVFLYQKILVHDTPKLTHFTHTPAQTQHRNHSVSTFSTLYSIPR